MTALARSLLSLWCLSLTVRPRKRSQCHRARTRQHQPQKPRRSRTAIQAMTRGQTAVTLAVATTPTDTLQDRINRIHLRMNLLGWKLVGQEYVASSSENSLLLLSYQR